MEKEEEEFDGCRDNGIEIVGLAIHGGPGFF